MSLSLELLATRTTAGNDRHSLPFEGTRCLSTPLANQPAPEQKPRTTLFFPPSRVLQALKETPMASPGGCTRPAATSCKPKRMPTTASSRSRGSRFNAVGHNRLTVRETAIVDFLVGQIDRDRLPARSLESSYSFHRIQSKLETGLHRHRLSATRKLPGAKTARGARSLTSAPEGSRSETIISVCRGRGSFWLRRPGPAPNRPFRRDRAA